MEIPIPRDLRHEKVKPIFLYLLKTSGKQHFSVFRGYRNGTLVWNGLNMYLPNTACNLRYERKSQFNLFSQHFATPQEILLRKRSRDHHIFEGIARWCGKILIISLFHGNWEVVYPFRTYVPFLYTQKMWGNQRFSDVFWG